MKSLCLKTGPGYLILAFIALSACQKDPGTTADAGDILWYDEPAEMWEQALPVGNGRIGAMVFGNPVNERIQLNDDSMWPADDGWEEPEGNVDDLERIRNLLINEKNAEADALFVEKFSNKGVVRSHQTLGELFITLDHQNVSNYKRELDLSKATTTVTYQTDGKLFKEEVYASYADQVIVIKLSTEDSDGFNGRIQLNRPEDQGHKTARTQSEGNTLVMSGEVTQYSGAFRSEPAPLTSGVKFETRVQVDNEGGEVLSGAEYLELKGVRQATLYLVSNSSYYHGDYAAQNLVDLDKIGRLNEGELYQRHINDFRSLYNSADFHLHASSPDSLPTDDRIELVKQGNTDRGLEELLFNYGRYLLISSSRKGTNPANLQGLWNQHITAPWNADYHLNINLQMNYWPANLTNLDELNMPLFDYIDKLVENGKVTAEKNFGCRGSFIPHATDLWAPTWLRAPTAYWGCSVGAAGWMMQHYWRHFEFTGDTAFLRERAFPAIEEVAKFYSDWLIRDPRDGYLVSAPSTSPENRFVHPNGDPVATCLGSAMDQQIIAEVFNNYIAAANILEESSPFLDKLKRQRSELRPGMVIGSDGRILEWDREYEEFEPGHRHMSHLYAFHPGSEVSIEHTPELFEAVKRSLDYRLDHGGAGTGWSRAWLINCSARLLDGEMAHEHIRLLIERSMYDNLFDAHPPFQIDGNFGYTSAVAEMLLQSHEDGIIRILPALPTAWPDGEVKGFRARGGITCDISWKEGKLEKCVLHPEYGMEVMLVYDDQRKDVSLEAGISYEFKGKAD